MNAWDLLAMLGIRSILFNKNDRPPVVAVLYGLVTAFLLPAVLWVTWNPGPIVLVALPVGYFLGYALAHVIYRRQILQSVGTPTQRR